MPRRAALPPPPPPPPQRGSGAPRAWWHSPPATRERSPKCAPRQTRAPAPRARSLRRGGGFSPLDSEAEADTDGSGTDSAQPQHSRQLLSASALRAALCGRGKRKAFPASYPRVPSGRPRPPHLPTGRAKSGISPLQILTVSDHPEKPTLDLGQGRRRGKCHNLHNLHQRHCNFPDKS